MRYDRTAYILEKMRGVRARKEEYTVVEIR